MIYTVTFNPALDYVMKFDNLHIGEVNRAIDEEIFCGGKGINVSLILKELEIESSALGFVSSFTGKVLEDEVNTLGVKTDFVHLKNGFTRINVKVKAEKESDLNGRGPIIEQDEIDELFSKVSKLKDGDILVLAGSVPSSLPPDIYERMLASLEGRNVKFVVDSTKDLLLNVLKYKPFLIKPNNHELGEMFSVEIKTDEDIIYYAKQLQQKGAQNVLISLAGDGALLLDANGDIKRIKAAKGKVVNSVGAGDSMVAGFIAGWLKQGDYEYALKLGSAAGSATAFSQRLAKQEDIYRILKSIT